MSTIKVGGDWAYYDQLDGVTIKHGERLKVAFPAGYAIIEACVVESTEMVNDHGHPYHVPVRKAFHKTNVLGIEVLVPLVGLPAWRMTSHNAGE